MVGGRDMLPRAMIWFYEESLINLIYEYTLAKIKWRRKAERAQASPQARA